MPIGALWSLITDEQEAEQRRRKFRSTVTDLMQGAQREAQQAVNTAGRLAGNLGEGFAADARNIGIDLPQIARDPGGSFLKGLDFYNKNIADPFAETVTRGFEVAQGNPRAGFELGRAIASGQDPLGYLRQSMEQRHPVQQFGARALFDPISLATGGLSGGARVAANVGIGALQGAATGAEMTGGSPLGTLAGGVLGGVTGSPLDILGGLKRNIAIPGSKTPTGNPSYAKVREQAEKLGVPAPTKKQLDQFYAAERAREKAAQTQQFNEFDQRIRPNAGWGHGEVPPNARPPSPREADRMVAANRRAQEREFDALDRQVQPGFGWNGPTLAGVPDDIEAVIAAARAEIPQPNVTLQPQWGGKRPQTADELMAARQPKEPRLPKTAAQQVGRYTVAEVGSTGAQSALRQVDESLLKQGPITQRMPGALRRVGGLLNPSMAQDRSVLVGAVAKQDVEAQLATRWTGTRESLINRVNDAFPSTPKFIGSAAEAPKGALKDSLRDVFDRPDKYDLTPQQRQVLLEVDQRNFEVFTTAREEYGIRLLPHDNGVYPSAYLPLIAKGGDPTIAANQFFQRTGLSGRTKERVYDSAWQRMAAEPDFVPETNIRTLLEAHDNALARDAGLETFKLGVGKTAAEMDALRYPKDRWVWDEVTQRYLPSDDVKNQVQGILRENFGVSWADKPLAVMDEIRGVHLGADLSPVTIQGGLAFAANPIGTAKQAPDLLRSLIRGNTMSRYLEQEPGMVERYAFVSGKRAGAPPAELQPSGVLEKIPGMAGFNQRMSDLIEARVYDLWKNDVALLKRWNPGISDAVADRDAYNMVAKVVGRMQFGEHGRSALAQKVARGGITSPSFVVAPAALVKDMFSGFAKLGTKGVLHPTQAWQQLAPREQLALFRGMRMAGTLSLISAGTAAAFAKQNNRSEEEAVRDVLDPNSPRFWTVTVDKASIPMGGPLRSFVKMVYGVSSKQDADTALRWGLSKLNAPVSVPKDLIKNQDYWGRPIMTGEDDRMKALQALWYAAGNLGPLSLTALSEGVRRGEPMDAAAVKSLGQLSGTNIMEQTPRSEIDYLARGRFGSDYASLEPHQQAQLKRDHPAIWQEYMQAGSPQMQMAWAERERIRLAQTASDERLQRGEIRWSQWREDLSNRRIEERAVLRGIYADRTGKVNDPIMAKYFAIMDASALPDGTMNWETFETEKAKLTPEEQAYIDRNTGIGNTPMVQQYRDLQRQARPFINAYYEIPPYLGLNVEEGRQVEQLRSEAQSYMAQYPQGAMSLKVAIAQVARQKGVSGKILATAMNADRLRNPARSIYRRQHPVIEAVQGDLNPLQQAA